MGSGIRRTSVLSCGTCSTAAITKANTYGSSRLSNWTELDVWQYIADERIDVPSIYFAHQRTVFVRDGMLMSVNEHLAPDEEADQFEARVRFRTVGDADCTGCVESPARTVEDIIQEVAVTRLTERGATRADDRISDNGMEDRKREGYF